MRVTILDGSRSDNTVLHRAGESLHAALGGQEVQWFRLREMAIRRCLGCFGCWIKTPGVCVIDDAGRDVAQQYVQSDLVVFMTPVTFGGYSSELKKAVDRLLPNILPFFRRIDGEIHHVPRYDRYPRIVVIGSLPAPDPKGEALFCQLVDRNRINFYNRAHVGFMYENADDSTVVARCQSLLSEVEVSHV